jgi:hypothetical protein
MQPRSIYKLVSNKCSGSTTIRVEFVILQAPSSRYVRVSIIAHADQCNVVLL